MSETTLHEVAHVVAATLASYFAERAGVEVFPMKTGETVILTEDGPAFVAGARAVRIVDA